jgi:hypothetical protein
LILEFVSLSGGMYLRTYYIASLMPAIAALVGIGVSVVWRTVRTSSRTRVIAAICVLGTAAYAAGMLLQSHNDWLLLIGELALFTIITASLLLLPHLSRDRWRKLGVLVGLATILLAPVAIIHASTSDGLGPFDNPLEGVATEQHSQLLRVRQAVALATFDRGEQSPLPSRTAYMAVDTSFYGADLGFRTPNEVLTIGGFTGSAPSPTLAQLKAYIAHGRLPTFLLPIRPSSPDARVQWVIHHCASEGPDGAYPVLFYRYHCSPWSLRSPPTTGTPSG